MLGIGQGASPRSGAANGLLWGTSDQWKDVRAAARASGVRSRAAPPVTQAAAQSRSPRLPRCPYAAVPNRRIRTRCRGAKRRVSTKRDHASRRRSASPGVAIRHRRIGRGGPLCRRRLQRSRRKRVARHETAHLTNERPRRARCEHREHHPLDDTVCAAEAGGAVAHPARSSGALSPRKSAKNPKKRRPAGHRFAKRRAAATSSAPAPWRAPLPAQRAPRARPPMRHRRSSSSSRP